MVYCSPEHRFGSDALLLARFCEPKRAQKAADLCSGCGIVALEWHDRGHRGPCMGLELQPEGSALLAAAVQEQDIGHIEPVCADLRAFRQGGLCENNDKFAIDRMLPKIDIGDIVYIHDTGAHGSAMGYNYNGKLRSAEVLLCEDGTHRLIRRAETPRDYFATLDFLPLMKPLFED